MASLSIGHIRGWQLLGDFHERASRKTVEIDETYVGGIVVLQG